MQHKQTIFFSSVLKSKYPNVFNTLSIILEKYGYSIDVCINTENISIRNFTPILFDEKCIQYEFEPSYLLGDIPNYVYLDHPHMYIKKVKRNKLELLFEDNKIMASNGIVKSSTEIFDEYMEFGLKSLDNLVQDSKKVSYFNLNRITENRESKISNILRFISENHLLVHANYYKKINAGSFKTTELKVKKQLDYTDTYMHFLQFEDLIIQPSFGTVNDDYIKSQLEVLYPNTTIEFCDIQTLGKDSNLFQCLYIKA